MQKGPLTPEFRALIAECRFHDAFPNSLASVFAALFGQLEGEALAELEREFRWVQVAGGTPLFRKGDTGDDMYIVINGRLRVVIEDLNGAERVMEEVGRGGNVGELALLTGERRSATVCAVRDSDLLQLSKAAFERLLERYPRAMMQIVRTAAWRARRARQYPGREGSAATSFAVVPAGPDVPVGEFARRLTQALSPAGDTLRLAAADVDKLLGKPSAAQSVDDSVGHASLVAWLSEQERLNRFVILEADAGLTPWTRRCLRQADHVLVVGRAGANPAPGEIEAALGVLGLKARVELVLLHPDSTEWPSNTGAWLAPRRIHAHHHARLANNGDLRRLARRLTDRAVGLVLGGGGARGFVHIGAIRALEEEGVEIDFVGGTSMGSLIAAVYATHHTVEEMVELARSFSSRRKLLDPTLPLTALMAGRKVTRLYRSFFGDARIEDLWCPFFAVSSSLSRATACIHRTGPVWWSIRASTAIPAIFPPVLSDEGEVLLDGGVMNNMPLDVMREFVERGTVIGVNASPARDKLKPYRFGPSVSGWQLLWSRMNPFGTRLRAPSLFGSLLRATEINSANLMRQKTFKALADLLIEPPVESFRTLDFDAYTAIIDIGHRAAREAITAWRGGMEQEGAVAEPAALASCFPRQAGGRE